MRDANVVASCKGGEVYVIRKRLKSKEITRELRHEKMCLRLLNQLQHPNIIRLLGSYTHWGEHNFLFPCVDMDMNHFFQRENRFGNFLWDFNFYSALHGLSSALSNTHRLYLNQAEHKVDFEAIGYHHDIRPANILVSKETFILADFGLGNLKEADAQSQTPWKSTTGDYLAPECMDEKHNRQDVSRAIDIWAFGCLIAEVVTYMQKGATGVKQFSNRRLSPGRVAHWKDSGFYNPNGDIKPEVHEWLKALPNDSSSRCLISSLIDLSLQALTRDPRQRPYIATICEKLALLSLRAHFVAVKEQFSHYVGSNPASVAYDRPTTKNLWFLQERFRAWGMALALDGNQFSSDYLNNLGRLHDKSIESMVTLFHNLENGAPKTSNSDDQYLFETRIDQPVEILWNLLPSNLRRRAEDYWHQAILSTEDSAILDVVHHALQSPYTIYNVADAIAKMRKVRLNMLRPDSFKAAEKAHIIKSSDVEVVSKENCHTLGRHKGKELVLVEQMGSTRMLEKMDPLQRDLVMDLKAKSLSIDPKPEGLKTLKCIGILGGTSDDIGYGFVYRYPEGIESDPTTLLQCLVRAKDSKGRPLLGDKFQLAFALADFLKEFHTIGWLHENFNSHNVLLFKLSARGEASDLPIGNELWRPYVVGLHKSRPDGSFWQTDGPAVDDNLQDYQHPDYAGTGRYRLSFDYYSLGIVLLEIGLWRPLSSLLSKSQHLTMVGIRSKLKERCQTELGAKMGGVYRDVVLRCIDGSLEGDLTQSEVMVRDELLVERTAALGRFTVSVVEPLEKLAKALI
jgi:serine/threonine protein kinase